MADERLRIEGNIDALVAATERAEKAEAELEDATKWLVMAGCNPEAPFAVSVAYLVGKLKGTEIRAAKAEEEAQYWKKRCLG